MTSTTDKLSGATKAAAGKAAGNEELEKKGEAQKRGGDAESLHAKSDEIVEKPAGKRGPL